MKRTSWLYLLLAFSVIYLSEAQYKFRRPQLPPPSPPKPPPHIFKKSWVPGARIPSLGNSIHIMGNFPHKRPLYNLSNYRFRRPSGLQPPQSLSMFNTLPSSYKSTIPTNYGSINNYGGMIQRTSPIKEAQSISKVSHQYSLKYRPKIENLSTRINSFDDDKGPIHTIPAPNLGPASKSYQQQQQQQLFDNEDAKGEEIARRPNSVTQVDYVNVFGGQESSVIPHRVSPSNPTSSNNIQHQYEVTESNEISSVPPTYFTPDFDSTDVQEQKTGEGNIYSIQPSSPVSLPMESYSSGIEPSTSIQANLHSSMHVDVSKSKTEVGQEIQASDLHVGQPSIGGPPVSATKLYEFLNAFPHQLTNHYTLNQQPQMQQHLFQQQLSKILQHQNEQTDTIKATFSQPAFHSFNYDEQTNKQNQQQHQQNIFIDKNYASRNVTADYSLVSETSNIDGVDTSEQRENNIEFENFASQVRPASYFNKITDDQNKASQFYTSLPNRETAEKLAALAAAGNVNSRLIDQLKKQQQQQQHQYERKQLLSQNLSVDQLIPLNHKKEHIDSNSDDDINQSITKYNEHKWQQEHGQKLLYHNQKNRNDQIHAEEDKKKHKQSSEEKRPLRIFVPEDNTKKEKEISVDDYEYENNDEVEVTPNDNSSSENSEFGSRIISNTGK